MTKQTEHYRDVARWKAHDSRELHPAHGFFVVETHDGRAVLGEIERENGTVTVYSGYVGRTPVLADEEVASIMPTGEHPNVEPVTQLWSGEGF